MDCEPTVRLLSPAIDPVQSLSAGALLTLSSASSAPPLLPPPLVDALPETRLNVDELALAFRSFDFVSAAKILIRAAIYLASRSSIVICFLLVVLRLPMLPVSDGSTSDISPSSPATDPGCENGALDFFRSWSVRRMILNVGWLFSSAGTSSEIRREGL